MNKKILVIFIAIFSLIIVFAGLLFLFGKKEDSEPVVPLITPGVTRIDYQRPTIVFTPIPENEVPTAPPTPVFTEGKILVSKIPVNDFTKTAVQTNASGDILIVNNEKFQIVFLKQFEEFKIIILGEDFEEIKNQAEQSFLQILGIDEANACRLSAEISSPAYAENEYSGIVLPLSFCFDL